MHAHLRIPDDPRSAATAATAMGIPSHCLYCRSCPSPWRPRGSGDGISKFGLFLIMLISILHIFALSISVILMYNVYVYIYIMICILYIVCKSCYITDVNCGKSWINMNKPLVFGWFWSSLLLNKPKSVIQHSGCWGPSLVWPGSKRNALEYLGILSCPWSTKQILPSGELT